MFPPLNSKSFCLFVGLLSFIFTILFCFYAFFGSVVLIVAGGGRKEGLT